VSTTEASQAERTVEFPRDALLDGVFVVELESGRPVFAVDATQQTRVPADVGLALSIPNHTAGRSAQLLSAFHQGTFQGLYIGNGTVSDADINAAAVHAVRDLKLGWIHVAPGFSSSPANRLALDVNPEAFNGLCHLDEIVAFHCNLGDEALGALCAPRCPSVLILVDTQVTANGLAGAARAGLRELVFSRNVVTYPHAESFGIWPDLARLTLEKVGLIDDQLAAITPMKHLQILELPDNDIFRRHFDGLTELPRLTRLDLARTKINDRTIESLGGLRGLQRLDLSATQVTDDGLKALEGIERLTGLYLGSCDITDDGLARIVERHPDLAILDISRTLITPEALPLLTRLPNLWRLELSQELVCRELLDMHDRFPKLEEFGFRGGIPEGEGWELTGELVDHFGAANFTGVR
jgi:hypothetical protein